ncbi:uncharacterized protein LOC108988644 [Juglans regia]|uniref:Uncharacterized protein LOC108988644 n=1 Tax=Juglans regia TaxID=51240 RepID=A0A2I4EDN9_JUGRE|nr:uncharacterized protein LOC108988644 [Juglans regia]
MLPPPSTARISQPSISTLDLTSFSRKTHKRPSISPVSVAAPLLLRYFWRHLVYFTKLSSLTKKASNPKSCIIDSDSGGVLDLFVTNHLELSPWDYLCCLCHHQVVNFIILSNCMEGNRPYMSWKGRWKKKIGS